MWQDAKNPLPEIAGLKCVLQGLLALPEVKYSQPAHVLPKTTERIAAVANDGDEREELLAPAQRKTDVASNLENPELYAVFPYRLFGVGQSELEMALIFHARGIQRNAGWHQDAIQAACLGLTEVAQKMIVERFSTKHEGSRFPAFWGPNYDWIPDQDHGGVAMIALQNMLLQTVGDTLHLLPAWPREWDVDFKLHAPQQTVIEGRLRDGVLEIMSVEPESRKSDLQVSANIS